MNNFGLGLILSFTDNATAGIRNAVNSLGELTQTAQNASTQLNNLALGAFSQMAYQMGDGMTRAGNAIVSSLTQVIGKVNETGMTLMQAENQLNKLYEGSAKTGKDVLNDISAYAKTSIFDFESLIPSVIMLKANGIEAFDMISSSTGKARQTLMDYAADLAAFNPQMRNAYGTGIQAAMGALNEYIAEGNAMSLKRGASLDITALLGEDKGATVEERSRQVADLMEKLNMVGMTAQLAQSPMTKLSNMGDTLFQFMGMISNSGVFDAYNRIITVLADFVNNIPQDRLESLAQSIGSALSMLLVPVEKLAQKFVELADVFLDIVAENPGLAKTAIVLTAVGGALLILGGIALKTFGTIGMLVMGLNQLKTIGSIATVMQVGVTKILGALIPLTLALGTMYFVWKNDLFGIRTAVTNFVSSVVGSFKTARSAVGGSLADMQRVLSTFDTQNNFFDGLTLAFMRIMMLGKALVDGWNDYTLSYDTWVKAKELGILPLIEAILDLKWRVEHFISGFMEGFRNVADRVRNFFAGLADAVDGTIFDSLLSGITSFFQLLSNNDPEAWTRFGEVLGDLAAKALVLFAAFKVGSAVFSVVSGAVGKVVGAFKFLKTTFSTVTGVFGKVFTTIKEIRTLLSGGMIAPSALTQKLMPVIKAFQKVISVVGKFGGAIKAALGTLAGAIGAPVAAVVAVIVAAVMSVVAFAVTHWEEFKSRVLFVWNTITEEASKIWNTLKDGLLSIWENIKSAVSPLVEKFVWLKDKVVSTVGEIANSPVFKAIVGVLSFIGNILTAILAPAISAIVTVVSTALQTIWNVFVTVFNTIVNVVSHAMQSIMDVIGGVIDIIVGIFTLDFGRVLEGVGNILKGIVSLFINIGGDIIKGLATGIGNVIEGVINTIGGFFTRIIDFVKNLFGIHSPSTVFAEIGGFLMQGLINGIQPLVDIVTGIFSTISSTITSILNGIHTVITSIFGAISSFLSGNMEGVRQNISNAWNAVKSIFTTVGNAIKSTVSNIFNGIKNTISNVINGAKNIVSNGLNAIKGFFGGLKLEFPKIKLPHFKVEGSLSLTPPSVPKLSIDWYANGGVFDQPSVIGVGESGKEAVMPLEQNTGWISLLANEIGARIVNANFTPVKSGDNNETTGTSYSNSENEYFTTNTTNAPVEQKDDHSVTFSEGSIVIYATNMSAAEAERLANLIMEKIKQKQRVEKVMSYN